MRSRVIGPIVPAVIRNGSLGIGQFPASDGVGGDSTKADGGEGQRAPEARSPAPLARERLIRRRRLRRMGETAGRLGHQRHTHRPRDRRAGERHIGPSRVARIAACHDRKRASRVSRTLRASGPCVDMGCEPITATTLALGLNERTRPSPTRSPTTPQQ